MTNYSSSYTFKYRQGFIHGATIDGNEVIKVNVDKYAYVVYVKSILACSNA